MKNYLKIFAPLLLVITIGSLTLMFAQTRGDRGNSTNNEKPGRGAPPPGFPPPGGGGGLHPGILRQLNLTEAQNEQIKILQENGCTAAEPFFEKIKTAQDQLNTATAKGAFNEEQIRVILSGKTAAMTELEINRLRTDAAIFNLLTVEQKAQAEELKAKPLEFGRGGFRPPMPPPQN